MYRLLPAHKTPICYRVPQEKCCLISFSTVFLSFLCFLRLARQQCNRKLVAGAGNVTKSSIQSVVYLVNRKKKAIERKKVSQCPPSVLNQVQIAAGYFIALRLRLEQSLAAERFR